MRSPARRMILGFIVLGLILTLSSSLQAEELSHLYQWSVTPPGQGRRVFLWIPEDCDRIRGLVLDMANLSECRMIEHPEVRRACQDQHVGIVWVAGDPLPSTGKKSPCAFAATWGAPYGLTKEEETQYNSLEAMLKAAGPELTPEQVKAKESLFAIRQKLALQAGSELDEILDLLATESGYEEIRRAPLLILSHSWAGRLPWYAPFQIPMRMWGAIPIKTWPRGGPPDGFSDSRMDGVPLLHINQVEPGEQAGPSNHALDGRRSNYLIGEAFDWGGSHFDMSDEMARLIALFIRKAASLRLSDQIPAEGFPKLKELKPEAGWLATSLLETEQFPAAPEPQYKGDKTKAFWFFDEEMTRAALDLEAGQRLKKRQYVTIVSNGKVQPYDGGPVSGDTAVEDGWTFKLTGAFLETVPCVKPGQTPEPDEGKPVGHAAKGDIIVKLAGGDNFVALDDQTFRYRQFNVGTGWQSWVAVTHPGDEIYARTTKPVRIWYPNSVKEGTPQAIDFPPIHDVAAGTATIKMEATSNVPGQVVEYYVVSGPARVVGDDPKYTGNTLRLTAIPPHARFPMKVMVVAYQMGRLRPPLVQSAKEVAREFLITKP